MPEIKSDQRPDDQTGKKLRKWKNIVINPAYQMKYIFWLTGSGLALCGLNAFIFYYFMKENYQILIELSPMTDEAKTQLYSELSHIIWLVLLVSIIFLIAVSIVGLVTSHRTAGPLFHFKRVFSEIKKGKYGDRICLRPGDEFHDVAKVFNEMMDNVERDVQTRNGK